MVELENPGDGQKISVEYEGWNAVTYVDVEPTGIDRLTSSQSGQMLLGGFVVAGLLIGLLLLIVRKNSVAEPHWDDEFEITSPEINTSVSPSIVESTNTLSTSRRSRRKLSHQRQQERIRAMKEATEEMVAKTEPTIVESVSQSSGVLQAMDGTIQGQTGWYQTAQGESQYWQVDETGQWVRVK